MPRGSYIEMSKLTNDQKQYIQKNMSEFENYSEFVKSCSSELRVSQKDVKEYLDEIFVSLMKTESNTQKTLKEESDGLVSDEAVSKARSMLRQAGLRDQHADDLLRRALSKVEQKMSNDPNVEAQALYNLAIASLNSSDAIIRETTSGREGIAVMTAAAAEKGDGEMKSYKTMTHKSRGAIFGTDGKEKSDGR